MAKLNCVAQFWPRIIEMYGHLLISNELYNADQDIQITNTKDTQLPKITISDYGDHNRKALSFNIGSCDNNSETKALNHDRGIELTIDPMDADETSQIVSLANIQSRFEETQTILKLDCYTSSKLYTEVKRVGTKVSNTAITTANILSDFDTNIGVVGETGVPLERVIMYYAPAFETKLKNAESIQRTLEVSGDAKNINRRVRSLDSTGTTRAAPASRLKTAFGFTEGFQVASVGEQISYIMVDPETQVSRIKYSYIKAFTPSHDSRAADKYLYQNGRFNGTFALLDDLLKQGRTINAEAEG